MTTILEKLDRMRSDDKLEYRDYSELHDLANELIAKIDSITEYQSHLLKSAVEHNRYEPRVTEVMSAVADTLARKLRGEP
jgi:hypothetical protein